jgi:Cu/Ag efflux protein CusF
MQRVPTTLFALLVLWACGPKIETPPPPVVAETERQDSPDRLQRTNTVQATAVVTHVDQKNRLVTLKASDGREQTVAVGPEVRNLPQVKRGDEVVVTYYESVVFQLLPPGSAEPGAAAAESGARAEPGQKPGAMGAEAVTVVATVVRVDKTAPSITLKGPDGNVVTLPVRDASKLDPVKVGDLLQISYSQALAVAVERP